MQPHFFVATATELVAIRTDFFHAFPIYCQKICSSRKTRRNKKILFIDIIQDIAWNYFGWKLEMCKNQM